MYPMGSSSLEAAHLRETQAMPETAKSIDVPSYADHVGLWNDELMAWVPDEIFDAHVHLSPPQVVGAISPERLKVALCTFSSLRWEELQEFYRRLYRGKHVAGVIAFPLPMREVDVEAANRYIIELMRATPAVKGFVLSYPTDFRRTRAMFEEALDRGVRFSGVKPYFDLLGKTAFECTMPEFIPEALLEFINRERLLLMLHTSGNGMGQTDNQEYLRSVMERFPRIRIILAHMGRYLKVEEFYRFCDCGLLEYPMLYLEMSSASREEVYSRVLGHAETHNRLLFGSDLPFGSITGVEAWSEKHGPIFVTRHRYPWSDPHLAKTAAVSPDRLTYNTYHTIKAFKDGLASMHFAAEQAETIKQGVFFRNATALFGA